MQQIGTGKPENTSLIKAREFWSPLPPAKYGSEEQKKECDLSLYAGEDRVISSTEWLAEHDREPPYLFSLKSRIAGIDDAIEGFRDGELYTISGFTKNGKTTLARTLTEAFVKQQVLPLWFTYEVPTKQFLGQWQNCPFFYLPRQHQGKSMRWFINRCEESFYKHGTKVIFIDHLHYLFDLSGNRSPSIDIGQIVRTLKLMATRNSILIFLICHTSKNNVGQTEPSYMDLRDSSFIAQESDSVLMIHRLPKTDPQKPDYAKVFIEFHRRTGVLRKAVTLQMRPNKLFGEMTEKYTEKQGWET